MAWEGKYIVTRRDGTPIPEGEPVFVLRAQDKLARDTITHYMELVGRYQCDPELLPNLRAHLEAVDAWPVKKWPDFAPHV